MKSNAESLLGARNVQVKEGELSGLPGVFLVYDFSPFLMKQTESVKPWSYVFTSICAIIGGAFSVATLAKSSKTSFSLLGCYTFKH